MVGRGRVGSRAIGALRRAVPLTGRGWAVLVLAVLAYAGGVLAGYPVFRALAGVALGALVAAAALTVRRPRVEVRRSLYPDRVERGSPALATLRVRNRTGRRQAALTAWDIAGPARRPVEIRPLAPGAEATYRYELPTSRRGLLQVGPLSLERGDPLRLTRRRLTAGETMTLWVHPKRHPAATAIAGRPRHHHEGRTTDDSLHGSAELRDIRPYVVGDEVRHVHWKASARTGRLMVRTHVDPDQPRLSLLLDTRARALPAEGFEEAVEVVASLVFGAAMAGHRCRLLTSNGTDLQPAPGPSAARVLLDELTTVEQETGDLPVLPAVLTAARAGGGAFVVVSGPGLVRDALAPLVTRYRPVTTIVLDPEGTSEVLAQRTRWIAAPNAAAAVTAWNTSGAGES